MKDLLDKISTYDLFNNLFPGILFVVIVEKITSYSLIQENIVLGVFLYYFIGSVISRLGSLVVEPFFKLFVTFADYPDYVNASKADPDIKLFNEKNNMYRTLVALLFSLLLVKLYELLSVKFSFLLTGMPYIILIGLGIMFSFAYAKQTGYIVKRVNKHKKDNNQP